MPASKAWSWRSLTAWALKPTIRCGEFLSSNPASKVLLEGHCDERGTKEYNIALGEKRAKAISSFLVVNGVSKSQIEVLSYGEERPANSAHNDAAWSQNRRVYIEYK